VDRGGEGIGATDPRTARPADVRVKANGRCKPVGENHELLHRLVHR
jgi:hypothetical protein